MKKVLYVSNIDNIAICEQFLLPMIANCIFILLVLWMKTERECFIEKRTKQWIKFSVSQEKMSHLSSLRKCFPLKSGLLSKTFATQTGRKKLVILGTGWGGYSLLRNIDKKLFDVVVISPRNYFLFTPMLASTTVGTVEFRYWLNFLAKIFDPLQVFNM